MADTTTTTHLLRTKLHPPPIPMDLVARAHLLQRLEQNRQRPLTLVCAPAGYGKSILVSSWLETCDCPSAWVSLDDTDNDLRQFLNYFLTAVETLFPDAVRKTRALVDATTLPPPSRLAESLSNDLDRIGPAFILVLDDYHRIRDNQVHDLLSELLRHPPPALHLVLAGRSDPPLPVSALRALGQLNEIRFQDLCFTPVETAEFLRHVLGKVDAATAAAWQEKTEGWVAGLRMAALVLGRGGDVGSLLPAREWGTQEAREYLFNEVLSRQPPGVRRRLLDTAILDRFCAPLCDAIEKSGEESEPGAISGWEFIARLQRENLFFIPLDTDNRWFRYHHLFQQLLRNQLERHAGPEEIIALHARASGWFAEEGLIEEALQHALAAGNPEKAGGLLAKFAHQLMNDQQWPRLERCLRLLPRDQVDRDPALLVLEAWLQHVWQNVSGMVACGERIEALNATTPPDTSVMAKHVPGHFEAVRGFLHYMAADGEGALACTERARTDLPLHHKRARLFADVFHLGAHQMVGDLNSGLAIYQEAMDSYLERDQNYHAMYLANLCLVLWMDADLVAVRQTADCLLRVVAERPLTATVPYGLYMRGIVQYHRNELQSAEEELGKVVGRTHHAASPMNFAHSAFALALTYQAQGRPRHAREIAEVVVADSIEANNADMLQVARAFEADLALRQGRSAAATRWAETYQPRPFRPTYRFYMPQLTLIRALLHQGTTDSRRQAADLLDDLHDFLVSIHNRRFQIDTLAFRAFVYDMAGEETAALEKLSAALALAEPGGFIRIFVDLGPQMADLLRRLIKQRDVSVDYIGQILAAFREDERASAQSEPETHPAPSHSPRTSDSARLLTERELEIVALLRQQFRNDDIGAKLFVSRETVKTHLKHIYKKLNVRNRRQAVAKARALGVLPRR